MDDIKRNFKYYQENKNDLCKKYLNQYLIIKDEFIYGVYQNMEDAIKDAKKLEAGTYILQKCEEQEDIQFFQTRVRFNEWLHLHAKQQGK